MNEQQDGEGAETPHHDSGGGEPTPADPQARRKSKCFQKQKWRLKRYTCAEGIT